MSPFQPERVKTLLVDLDGTLLDNERWKVGAAFIQKTLSNLSARVGWRRALFGLIAVKREVENSKGSGKSNLERGHLKFAQRLKIPESISEKLYRDLLKGVFPGLARYFAPKEGAKEFIRWARGKYRLILATNPVWPAEIIEMRLQWAEIPRESFEFISDASRMSAIKPSEVYYRELLKQTSTRVDECLLIGNDRKMDLPASSLGIPVFIIRKATKLTKIKTKNAAAFRGSFDHLQKLLATRSVHAAHPSKD
jgi:FMN phosphatase YigB (HAD superfamily)